MMLDVEEYSADQGVFVARCIPRTRIVYLSRGFAFNSTLRTETVFWGIIHGLIQLRESANSTYETASEF